ncbi:MAG: type IV secretion system protein [Hyphomicrobiales bacterium]|nr:type IV secretion system protein [Hyphomicrobiales bacterium]MDE2115805.1 type IV secretion system protein [Hyphomicrobiales bacterium]
MAMTIITTLLGNVDKIGATYVQNAYTALNDAMQVPGGGSPFNVFQLMLILYIIYWGFEIWAGTARGTPTEIFWRLFRVLIIFSFAQTWADFQFYVYNFLQNVPNIIGNALIGSMGATAPTGVTTGANNVASQLDNILTITMAAITSFTAAAHWWNYLLDLLGALVYMVVVFLVCYAGFLIILCKIFTWILLALAPIILLLALFRVTSIIVINWVKLLLEYFFLQILVYAFLGFFMILSQSYFAALAQTLSGSVGTVWSDILPIVTVGLISFLLLSQLQRVAASLVGIQSFATGFLGGAQHLALGASTGLAAVRSRRIDQKRGYSSADSAAVQAELGRDRFKQTPAYKAMVEKLRDSGKMSGQATVSPASNSSSSGGLGFK